VMLCRVPTLALSPFFLSRGLPTPYRLQKSIALRQSVQAVVALGTAAHEAAERVDLVLPGVAARLIHFADADLDRGVVFSFDDAVCGGALARNVTMVRVGKLEQGSGELWPGIQERD